MCVAISVAGSSARPSGMLRKNAGVFGEGGPSAPRRWTWAAPAFSPARFKTSPSRTPAHSACPTAPRSHATPGDPRPEKGPPVPRTLEHGGNGHAAQIFASHRERTSRGDRRARRPRGPRGQPDGRRAEVAADEELAFGVSQRSRAETGVSRSSGREFLTIRPRPAGSSARPTSDAMPPPRAAAPPIARFSADRRCRRPSPREPKASRTGPSGWSLIGNGPRYDRENDRLNYRVSRPSRPPVEAPRGVAPSVFT